MNNIIDAILQLVNENTGNVCCYEEDFDPMDFLEVILMTLGKVVFATDLKHLLMS